MKKILMRVVLFSLILSTMSFKGFSQEAVLASPGGQEVLGIFSFLTNIAEAKIKRDEASKHAKEKAINDSKRIEESHAFYGMSIVGKGEIADHCAPESNISLHK